MTTKLTEHKGTSVKVYGTVGNFTLLPCSYSIDGGAGIQQVATMQSSNQYQFLFFQSQELTADFHSLLITTLESDPSGGTLYLDFFAVTPLPIATASLLPSSTTSALLSSTTSLSPSPSSTSKPPTGPIIGGVLGGLALLTFAFIAFLFFRWKKKEPKYNSEAYRSGETGLGTL
jgi:hypothetical protein